jgi:hypothetical protein
MLDLHVFKIERYSSEWKPKPVKLWARGETRNGKAVTKITCFEWDFQGGPIKETNVHCKIFDDVSKFVRKCRLISQNAFCHAFSFLATSIFVKKLFFLNTIFKNS